MIDWEVARWPPSVLTGSLSKNEPNGIYVCIVLLICMTAMSHLRVLRVCILYEDTMEEEVGVGRYVSVIDRVMFNQHGRTQGLTRQTNRQADHTTPFTTSPRIMRSLRSIQFVRTVCTASTYSSLDIIIHRRRGTTHYRYSTAEYDTRRSRPKPKEERHKNYKRNKKGRGGGMQ